MVGEKRPFLLLKIVKIQRIYKAAENIQIFRASFFFLFLSLFLNILLWLLPICVTVVLSYIYFGRGRHLGSIERPALDIFHGPRGVSA